MCFHVSMPSPSMCSYNLHTWDYSQSPRLNIIFYPLLLRLLTFKCWIQQTQYWSPYFAMNVMGYFKRCSLQNYADYTSFEMKLKGKVVEDLKRISPMHSGFHPLLSLLGLTARHDHIDQGVPFFLSSHSDVNGECQNPFPFAWNFFIPFLILLKLYSMHELPSHNDNGGLTTQ